MWCRHIIQNFRGRQRNLKGCFKSMSNHIRSRLFWRCTLFSKNMGDFFFNPFFLFPFSITCKNYWIFILHYTQAIFNYNSIYADCRQNRKTKCLGISSKELHEDRQRPCFRYTVQRNLNITELPIITSWYIKKKVKIAIYWSSKYPPPLFNPHLNLRQIVIYTGKPKGHWYL